MVGETFSNVHTSLSPLAPAGSSVVLCNVSPGWFDVVFRFAPPCCLCRNPIETERAAYDDGGLEQEIDGQSNGFGPPCRRVRQRMKKRALSAYTHCSKTAECETVFSVWFVAALHFHCFGLFIKRSLCNCHFARWRRSRGSPRCF